MGHYGARGGGSALAVPPAVRERPAAAPGQDDEETTTEVESDRYIWLECRCVAHQYIPKKAGDQNTRSSRPDESETRRRSR